MNFIKVAQISDIEVGGKLKISWQDKEILLTNIQNTYYAVDNVCPHMGGSLDKGKLDGNHIICPRHGSVFDVVTGKVVLKGKLLFLNVAVHDLHSYPVKIEGTDLLVGFD